MRILHTSDWHIGRTFHGVDLLADQRRALIGLADLVVAESIDVVAVAGDVYDRSVPSADAVTVYDAVLEAIRDAGARIVVTSGNHDSPTRLGAGSGFAAAGGLHLRTTVAGISDPIRIADEHGDVAFYGIPYLEPDVCRAALGVPQARSHAEVLDAAMSRVRAHLEAHPARSFVLAHAFVVGAVATGSERSISVGGVETVPASTFSGVDYVALGHLHSPQIVTDSVRYSGSPLPYSFGERTHHKGVWIVDLDADGVSEIRPLPLHPVRGLSRLTGTVADLVTSPDHAHAEDDYVEAILTDAIRPVDAMRTLRERFPLAVHVEWQNPRVDVGIDYRDRVRGRTDSEIVSSFVSDVRSEPTARELLLLDSAVRAVGGDVETGPVELMLFDVDAELTA